MYVCMYVCMYVSLYSSSWGFGGRTTIAQKKFRQPINLATFKLATTISKLPAQIALQGMVVFPLIQGLCLAAPNQAWPFFFVERIDAEDLRGKSFLRRLQVLDVGKAGTISAKAQQKRPCRSSWNSFRRAMKSFKRAGGGQERAALLGRDASCPLLPQNFLQLSATRHTGPKKKKNPVTSFGPRRKSPRHQQGVQRIRAFLPMTKRNTL